MFANTFKIYIISENTKIENAIEKHDKFDDSEYIVNTISNQTEVSEGNDSIIIADGNSIKSDEIKLKAGYKILILSFSDFLASEESVNSLFDDIWVMPDNDLYNEKILLTKFNRLLKLVKTNADTRKMQICFDTTIDSLPDLIWYKDRIGAHLKVNDGFCKAVQKTKEQIYKKGHYYVWDIPKEEYEQGDYVCLESEDIVIDARKTCLFDERVKTKSGMRLFKTYKSPLIDTDGNIFGTCGIAHDVTDLQNINTELAVLLESIPFAIFVENNDGKIISVNSKFKEYFSADQAFNNDNWKSNILNGKEPDSDGAIELTVNVNGKERILIFHEDAIIDIFQESIGKLGIFRDITIERHYEQQTLLSANTDFLTGLNNRRSLFEHLNEIKNYPKLAFISIDLDNFKKVNDIYGHHFGDTALQTTAKIMKKCFPKDFIARLGGDEFLIVIGRHFENEEIEALSSNLLDSLINAFKDQVEFSIMTASIGIACSDYNKKKYDDNRIENLLKCSDSALYTAKNAGKSQYCFYAN